MENPTIVLLLRGHIRDSFKDKRLFNFVRELGNMYNLKIYIHTWNIYSTKLSWREVKENNNNVTMTDIVTYFNGVKCTFQHVDIDDDSKINLIGDTTGNVFSTRLPKIAWKRMWYGINKIVEIIKANEDLETLIVNTRFDLFDNSNSYSNINTLIELIVKNVNKKLEKNVFLQDDFFNLVGVDNYFLGNTTIMYGLVNNFHKNLDELNEFYKRIYYQEVTVFYENNKLFDTDNNRFQENIESYYLTANNTAFKNSITSMKLNENKSSIPNIQNRRFPEQTVQDESFLKESAIIKEKGLNLLNYSITNSSSKDNKIIFNLNKSVIREPATIGIKNTVSNWHGFGNKG